MANKCPICKETVRLDQSFNCDYKTNFIRMHLACFAKTIDDPKDEPTPEEAEPDEDDGIEDPSEVPA